MTRGQAFYRVMKLGGVLLLCWCLGPEREVWAGAYEGGVSVHPQLAMDADGSFVMVWSDRSVVLAQRYDADGVRTGDAFPINEGFPELMEPADVLSHSVAMDRGGRFVVVWEVDPIEIRAPYRLFDREGRVVAEGVVPFRARPDVGMAPSGGFVVSGLNLTGGQILASAFDRNGVGLDPLIFASAGPYRPWDSAVALNDAGNLYVAFEETRRSNDVVVGGLTLAGESVFQHLLTLGTLEGRDPDVAADAAGNVATVWEARDFVCVPFRGSLSITNVYLNVHGPTGEEILPATRLNVGMLLSADADPVVAIDERATVTVAFVAGVNEVHQVLLQTYRLGEALLPDPLLVSGGEFLSREKRNPSIAVRADGRTVVAWESLIIEGGELTKTQTHYGVFGYEGDLDRDGVLDADDGCVDGFDPSQSDLDLDGVGDVCDGDIDGDTVANDLDNCPRLANVSQVDTDLDSVGDVCDNCPDMPNVGQGDCDFDGVGNLCDLCFDGGRCALFERGDSNSDGALDLSDGIAIVNALFLGVSVDCRDAMDVDDDGVINITDAIFLLNFLFLGGVSLPPPTGGLGTDPTPEDGIGCCVCEQYVWLAGLR